MKAQRNKNIIGCGCFFTVKSKSEWCHEYEARFVDNVYSQIYGEDYRETFAPTTNMASVRLLLQKTVQCNLFIHHMDGKSGYLIAPP